MDAQNAAGPASTKPAAASLKRSGSDADQPHDASTTSRSPKITRRPSVTKESRPNLPPTQDDSVQDGNSDAETIVLPGKDGLHSPSKVRKIKNEDGEAPDRAELTAQRRQLTSSKHERDGHRKDRDRAEKLDKPSGPSSSNGPSEPKKKKLLERPDQPRTKDGSSGLSSAPASPPPQQRRRRLSKTDSDAGSERAHGIPSLKPATSEKTHLSDKLVPHKRKASRVESDEEAENRKIRRQRISGSGLSASRHRDAKPGSKMHNEGHGAAPARNRSASPPPRPHRRSVSTQLSTLSANGLSQKKKRIPAPLQSTEYHSDDSSASGSPHPRSSKIRSLTTPATAEMSPAKIAPHKKHLDAHGQTHLARACARGEYDVAKSKLQERPEDINVADFAGNTPLQIAALNGYEDIVQLLIDAGCSLDCVNYDKDTPLLDAVDNGHLGVVKLLLAAGVNPRKPNAYGEEPLDRVTDETDNAAEIRQALTEAKQRLGERRRTSEEHHPQDRTDSRSSHGPESSRRSPGAGHGTLSRRVGTVRSEKTSNHLLYMPMDDRTLRAAAAKGDEETVTRILQVRESFDDPESMVAAARGGHEMVMNLLLALGGANPDPRPLDPSNEYSTPMLAAIGQENIKVVRLLLDQSNFDPTGTFKGEAYHEIARRRKGPNWIEEEEMLKKAYDEYRKTHKESAKTKSPSKRDHEQRSRIESKEGVSKIHKRKASTPTREAKKANSGKPSTGSPKEKRRSNSFSGTRDEQTSPKRGPGRPKKEDRIPTIAVSDHEGSPGPSKHAIKAKRTDSEMAASSEGEAAKPRRKLVSGRELKGEREKQQRRSSLTSNASSLRDPPSPHELKRDEPLEKQQKSEKYHDRTKALKRDESRDRLSVAGENPAKRHRASATPPRHGSSDKDGSEAAPKRRKLDVAEGKEKRQKLSSSPDDRPHKPPNREGLAASGPTSKPVQKAREEGEQKAPAKHKKPDSVADSTRKENSKPKVLEKSIHVKAEDPDIQMRNTDVPVEEPKVRSQQDKPTEEDIPRSTKPDALNTLQEARKKAEERERKRKDDEEREAREKESRRKEEEEVKRRAEEDKRKRDEEEQKKRRDEEERKVKEEEEKKRHEAEAQLKRQREAEEVRKREEAERKKREEEERKQREEEEKRVREEAERKRRVEEEKRRKEEDERRKLEEEARLRREQLEREAAEEARRKREEEERRSREEADRRQREEMERRRAAREAERLAEQRRVQLEQERVRLSKLPPLLRWLDTSSNPRLTEVARKFSPMQGVRYDCIRPEATGTADGREQWLLNTQVALLLGEKDLTLSRYTAWEHVPASDVAKQTIWRLEADRYALTSPNLYDLGRQLPEYYGGDPEGMSYRVVERLRREAWQKFAAMDMFFVKASDLMFIVPTIAHLRSLELAITYRELPEHESQLRTWAPLQKWKTDPDANRFYGFAPRNKYYIDGQLIREDVPGMSAVSKCPFPEKRVPRRGLQAVSPDDPDYSRLCREQGLDHLLSEAGSPRSLNGVPGSSPTSAVSNLPPRTFNGPTSPLTTHRIVTANGNGTHRPMSPSSDPGAAKPRPLVNGINGTSRPGRE